jgi:ankyrin repeat protein
LTTTDDFIDAIKAGAMDKVRQMLDHDPSLVDAKADNGLSAVLVAAYYNEPDIARLLAQRGASLNVFEATAVGALERVKEWITDQPDLINAYAPDGFQPLGLAAFFGHTPVVEFLLDKGAEINSPSKNRMRVRPLHSAIANRRTDIVKRLLDHGAEVNTTQADDFAPLHEAAQNGLLDVTHWLLDRSANANARLANGQTPLTLAIEAKHPDVAELLKRYGASG